MRSAWSPAIHHPGGRVTAVTGLILPARLAPMLPLRWRIGNEVSLAFSEAGDGDLRQPAPRAAWLRRVGVTATCVVPSQVHGPVIVAAAGGDLARADGVVSADPGLALGVFGADC